MNKRLLKIVMHNYFTYCLFSVVVCLPIMFYEVAKEAYVKQVAEKYKDQLDPRAYQALINYEVNEND